MANDNFTQQALANDPTFRQRLKASLSRVAWVVLTESVGPNTPTRRAYARAFVANPDSVVAALSNSFVFRTNVFAAATAAAFDGRGGVICQSAVTDAALDSQLTSDWDSLAGV